MYRFLNMFFYVSLLAPWAYSAGRAPGDSNSATGAPNAGILTLAPWLLIFAIFYFLLIRPQQKQTKERQVMLDSLKRGDSILTQGGFYGVVTGLKGPVVELKLNDDVKVKVDKSAITRIFREDNDPTKSQPVTS